MYVSLHTFLKTLQTRRFRPHNSKSFFLRHFETYSKSFILYIGL